MSDFWARKLSPTHQPPPRPSSPVVGPAWWQAPPPTPSPQHQPPPVRLPTKAIAARHTETCDSCGSGNFLNHCFDCGWPLVQAGSGVSGTGTETVQAARQLPGFLSAGYHPEIIVDHIR